MTADMELKKYLSEKIARMMEKNFDLLLSSSYRIDIDENKVKFFREIQH